MKKVPEIFRSLYRFIAHLREGQRRKWVSIPADVFVDAQIASKLWLCRELENALKRGSFTGQGALVLHVYAGWCGILPFLIFSRENIEVRRIELTDIDPEAVAISLQINERWRSAGKYVAYCRDVNDRIPQKVAFGETPDILINTSCEHFHRNDWWQYIQGGTLMVLQGTDMESWDHVTRFESLSTFRRSFTPWEKILFEGQLDFCYANLSFSRFMVIGTKGQG